MGVEDLEGHEGRWVGDQVAGRWTGRRGASEDEGATGSGELGGEGEGADRKHFWRVSVVSPGQ